MAHHFRQILEAAPKLIELLRGAFDDDRFFDLASLLGRHARRAISLRGVKTKCSVRVAMPGVSAIGETGADGRKRQAADTPSRETGKPEHAAGSERNQAFALADVLSLFGGM